MKEFQPSRESSTSNLSCANAVVLEAHARWPEGLGTPLPFRGPQLKQAAGQAFRQILLLRKGLSNTFVYPLSTRLEDCVKTNLH